MSSLTIRKATIEDLDAIVAFQAAMALESEGTVLNIDTVRKGVSAALSDESKGMYIVAELEGVAAGSLMVTREWSDWNNCWYWWLQSVYVAPQHRRKGIFKAMFSKVKEMAEEEGISELRLYVDKHNDSAQNTYRALGMEECHYLMFSLLRRQE